MERNTSRSLKHGGGGWNGKKSKGMEFLIFGHKTEERGTPIQLELLRDRLGSTEKGNHHFAKH